MNDRRNDPTPGSATPPRPRFSTGLALGAIALLVLGALIGTVATRLATRHAATASGAPSGAEAKLYQCPMHPTITSDHPGTCPICGMKLVEVTGAARTSARAGRDSAAPATPANGLATVTIDPSRQQLIGLQTAPVTRGPVAGSWRTVGRVEVDPTRVRKTNVKVDGYVERLFVDFEGVSVRRGEPLFSLYSPALYATENELVLALRTRDALRRAGARDSGGADLVAAARRKLALWDVPAAEIDRIERTREPSRTLTFLSPVSGVVTAKSIVQGASLRAGDSPYEITDLSMVWIMADAYEGDLAHVQVGMPASFTLRSDPGRAFRGMVAFVDPLIDPATRTAKVHMHFDNPGEALKPGMYGDAVLVGGDRTGLRVPADAVIRSGTQDVVFLALGEGKFAPRVVELGARNATDIEVRSGLAEGDRVVTRANFLIDSESQLRASLAALGERRP